MKPLGQISQSIKSCRYIKGSRKFLKVGPVLEGVALKRYFEFNLFMSALILDVAKYWEQILFINNWQQKSMLINFLARFQKRKSLF